MSISILVADAHRLVSDALVKALNGYGQLRAIKELPSSGQDLIGLAGQLKPDVVLLDWWIPGMDAASATRMIHAYSPDSKVLIMSWLYGAEQIQEGLEAGATGFLPKSLLVEDIVNAIGRAVAGESPVYEKELDKIIRTISERGYRQDEAWQRLALLTPREIQILKLMDDGRLVEQVARQLEIKSSTVRNHIHNILVKTGTQTHVQALAIARNYGLIRT